MSSNRDRTTLYESNVRNIAIKKGNWWNLTNNFCMVLKMVFLSVLIFVYASNDVYFTLTLPYIVNWIQFQSFWTKFIGISIILYLSHLYQCFSSALNVAQSNKRDNSSIPIWTQSLWHKSLWHRTPWFFPTYPLSRLSNFRASYVLLLVLICSWALQRSENSCR